MVRFLKFLAGLGLLPFGVAATQALWDLLQTLQPASLHTLPLSAWGLLVGFALWLVVFFAMPRPVRSYVLAHELTHALWGWVMGARVSRLKVGARGGSVALSKTNFLIALAPYFFPLYTMLIIAGYYLLILFVDLRTYEPFWLGLVGLTWGFHLTFTITTLMTHQPDIKEHGRVFSYAVIYLFNILGICLWVVMVTSPSLLMLGQVLWVHTLILWTWIATQSAALWRITVPLFKY